MESGAFSTKRGTRPFRCCMTGSAPFPKGWRQPKKTGNGGFSIRRAISSSRLSTIPQWEKDSPTGSYRSGKTAGKGIWIKPDAWRFYWIPDMRPCVVFTADLPSWRRIRLPAGKPETGPPRIRRGNRRFTGRSTGRTDCGSGGIRLRADPGRRVCHHGAGRPKTLSRSGRPDGPGGGF